MQTEVLMTGIGGQGVQLAARTIALGAIEAGRQVMFTSEYGGEMRGGISTATLILATENLRALPVVPSAGAAVAMHDKYWPLVSERLRPGGLLLLNSSLWERGEETGFRVVRVPATQIAVDAGAPMSASLVIAGAFATLTGLAPIDVLCDAMERSVPAYRRQHLPANIAALQAGAAQVTADPQPLLPPSVARVPA